MQKITKLDKMAYTWTPENYMLPFIENSLGQLQKAIFHSGHTEMDERIKKIIEELNYLRNEINQNSLENK